MDELSLARAVHVVSIVAWIGGVYFVTFILLPSVRQMADPEDRAAAFERFEHRFALHARVATLAAGASGFYITHLLDAWDRFADSSYWWMHAMTAIWAVFTLVLFVLEPLFLHAWFSKRARTSRSDLHTGHTVAQNPPRGEPDYGCRRRPRRPWVSADPVGLSLPVPQRSCDSRRSRRISASTCNSPTPNLMTSSMLMMPTSSLASLTTGMCR